MSSATTVVMHTGDALSFAVADWNFSINAADLGLPLNPTHIGFTLVTTPLDPAARFSAVLESSDGSVSLSFGGPLAAAAGQFQGAYYHGAISAIEADMPLSGELSQQLFAGRGALLTLRNTGPDVLLGLAPYTLQQDLNVSLFGGGLNLGAPQGPVTFSESPAAQVPEPLPGALLGGGAAVLAALSLALRRISHLRIR
ncbi:MAG: hypothetical protein LAP87_25715 [Acidobacteriia bacterium]|nr:hypothetical protein [Terriglobia bacterium]